VISGASGRMPGAHLLEPISKLLRSTFRTPAVLGILIYYL